MMTGAGPGLPYGGVATQPPSGRRGSRAGGDGGGPSWTRRGSAGDSEPQQRGWECEKRSEENPSFYLKTCQECEQTGVKKGHRRRAVKKPRPRRAERWPEETPAVKVD
ncbi:Nuclear pore complex-interacting protein family member B11 [Manis javanica]|nr:Nuclear pore complex-interacting protein family member B11 [Manis javanica]